MKEVAPCWKGWVGHTSGKAEHGPVPWQHEPQKVKNEAYTATNAGFKASRTIKARNMGFLAWLKANTSPGSMGMALHQLASVNRWASPPSLLLAKGWLSLLWQEPCKSSIKGTCKNKQTNKKTSSFFHLPQPCFTHFSLAGNHPWLEQGNALFNISFLRIVCMQVLEYI